MHARVKRLNPHANTPAVVKMNEINPKYENTQKIHRLLFFPLLLYLQKRISFFYPHVPQTAKFIQNTSTTV
jgi:hypothetical protein